MKNSFLILLFSALFFVGCTNTKTEQTNEGTPQEHPEGTHTHEDGTIHKGHHHDHKQEEFKAGSDSTKAEGHNHEGHDHQH